MSLREHEPMLAAMASKAERANRPTAVVVFCTLLLVGAVGFTIWSSGRASEARAAFRREAQAQAEVERLTTQIEEARERKSRGENELEGYSPETALLSKIGQAASRALIEPIPRLRTNTESMTSSPLVRQVVTATVDDHEMEKVLAWITNALNEVDGLYVTEYSMKPTRKGWEVTVKFARWELST